MEDLRGEISKFREHDFNADILHALYRRVQSEGGRVVELWTTNHGELVIVRRALPDHPHSSLSDPERSALDSLQAKIQPT